MLNSLMYKDHKATKLQAIKKYSLLKPEVKNKLEELKKKQKLEKKKIEERRKKEEEERLQKLRDKKKNGVEDIVY